MKCCVENCKTNSPLYRQNAKGKNGIFACLKHSKPIEDKELVKLTKDIHNGLNNGNKS